MNISEIKFLIKPTRLSSSQISSRVKIIIESKFDEILENPRTGSRTLTGSTPGLRREHIEFNLLSSSNREIEKLLRNRLVSYPHWVCAVLASDISKKSIALGFGRNLFALTVFFKVTYETVVVMSEEASSLKAELSSMIRQGVISRRELKSLDLETEPCSICLDDLSGSSKHGAATRMNCSHVFHDRCLLEWLQRKNSCPLCRTVLYDR